MGYPPEPRLSFGPLERFVGDCWTSQRQRSDDDRTRWVEAPIAMLADAAGMSRREVHRWRHEGIPTSHADRICCEALGVHPSVVWGDEWWED